MDLKMPVMDGFEATRIIKKLHPELPVVVQSAYSGREERENAFSSGCDDFLSKPIRAGAVNAVVRRYMIMK